MKECRDCKITKENTEFAKRLCNSDGLYSYCNECTRAQGKVCYEKHKVAREEKAKIYRDKNKTILCEKAQKYYYDHREAVLKKSEIYRAENKQKISLREAKRRIRDPERFEKNRLKFFAWSWSKEVRDRLNEYQRVWYQKNKEKRRAHVILNRSVKSGAIKRPPLCSECHKECKPDGHHEDYTKPLEVIWICRACHSRKSPRTVIK